MVYLNDNHVTVLYKKSYCWCLFVERSEARQVGKLVGNACAVLLPGSDDSTRWWTWGQQSGKVGSRVHRSEIMHRQAGMVEGGSASRNEVSNVWKLVADLHELCLVWQASIAEPLAKRRRLLKAPTIAAVWSECGVARAGGWSGEQRWRRELDDCSSPAQAYKERKKWLCERVVVLPPLAPTNKGWSRCYCQGLVWARWLFACKVVLFFLLVQV